MPRYLALDWDDQEARVAVARTSGRMAVIEAAFTIALPEREEGKLRPPAIVAELLSKEFSERGLAKLDTLLALGRGSVELRTLSIPPAPAEEQPDLVRFQALRQFSALGDEWPLDFVPLGSPGEGGVNVLAAALAPENLRQVQNVGAQAGVVVKRITLRPFAAAALVRAKVAGGHCTLSIDILGDEAEMGVLVDGELVFPRTVRLPAREGDAFSKSLLAEARRTMVAAQNQLGGRKVEQLILLGDGRHHSQARELLQTELKLTAELLDPFSLVECDPTLRDRLPAWPGSFAPVLGMLVEEAAGRPPVLDFLAPRRRPAPPDRSRLYQLIGGLVGAAALLLAGITLWDYWRLGSELTRLNQELARQTKLAKGSELVRRQGEELDQFASADYNWLDELKRLSEEMPPGEVTQLYDLSAALSRKGGGSVVINGGAKEPETIVEMESVLRTAGYGVFGSGPKQPQKPGKFAWEFRDDLALSALDPDTGKPLPHPEAVKPAPAAGKAAPASKAVGTNAQAPASSAAGAAP
jgi:Tfp pilus assembly PilM family ATPase